MWLIRLAWKNLWRNRSRTLITLSAVFFAVILSTAAESLKQGVFDNLVKNVVSFYTGYIQIHHYGYQDEQVLDNAMLISDEKERRISSVENVRSFTRRLESFALASGGELTKGCLVAGIDPEQENKITHLKEKVVAGSYLSTNDKGVLLGEELAKRMKLTLGDTIYLIGQGYHGAMAADKFPVTGIVRFGTPQMNEKMLFMSLSAAQTFFSAEKMATSYILLLNDNKAISSTALALENVLGKDHEVMTWEELLPEIKQHIATDTNNMKIVQAILYLLICFGIFSTMLMMLMERTFEMGMLISIGMKKSLLILMLLMESILSVLTGCLFGLACSIPIIRWLAIHPLRMSGEAAKAYERFGFEAIFPASTDVSIYISQAITVMIIGFVLAIYPAVKIIRLKPTEALKK